MATLAAIVLVCLLVATNLPATDSLDYINGSTSDELETLTPDKQADASADGDEVNRAGRVTNITTTLAPAPGAVCPAPFYNSPLVTGCYAFVTTTYDWEFAGMHCKELHKDAHLLVINGAVESAAVKEFVDKHYVPVSYVWTAGQRLHPGTNSSFIWRLQQDIGKRSDAERPITYTNWRAGYPDNNAGRESCIEAAPRHNMQWNDVPCDGATYSVCEIDISI